MVTRSSDRPLPDLSVISFVSFLRMGERSRQGEHQLMYDESYDAENSGGGGVLTLRRNRPRPETAVNWRWRNQEPDLIKYFKKKSKKPEGYKEVRWDTCLSALRN
jgi:hypothetical protein